MLPRVANGRAFVEIGGGYQFRTRSGFNVRRTIHHGRVAENRMGGSLRTECRGPEAAPHPSQNSSLERAGHEPSTNDPWTINDQLERDR